MTVRIDVERCNGCGKRIEGFCEEICPGDLFYREHGKARLREPCRLLGLLCLRQGLPARSPLH